MVTPTALAVATLPCVRCGDLSDLTADVEPSPSLACTYVFATRCPSCGVSVRMTGRIGYGPRHTFVVRFHPSLVEFGGRRP